MSKVCAICGKRPVSGHNVSHAHNLTKRRFLPNLQRMKALVNGTIKHIRICAKCIKAGKLTKPLKRA